ncbi:MAG: type II secretion system protein [bacterium]|nr:type II secretion system protein [bacterium]
MKSKGFTLIELLVVIAIIGILSSVVLASLNTARGKGANASIKANLANTRAQAEIIYDTSASYTGLCTNAVIAGQTASANSSLGGSVDNTLGNAGATNKVSCHESSTAWAINSGLKVAEGSNTMWCVDSTGASKGGAAFAASATVCP